MSRHHRRRGRIAVLAASAFAAVGVATLGGASSALAVTCEEAPGYASGSSLQKSAAIETWLTEVGWGKHTLCENEKKEPLFPKVTYTSTASGPGLNEFGNIEPELNEEEDQTAIKSATGIKDHAGKVLDWYVGTDDPPSQGNLTKAMIASGDKKENLEEITIPVAQSPVTMMMSLPTGCVVANGFVLKLDGKTLLQIWEAGLPASSGEKNDPGGLVAQGGYKAGTWGALLTQLKYESVVEEKPTAAGKFHDAGGAEGCEQPITLQVRSTDSGTTFVWKTYLYEADNYLFYNFKAKKFSTNNVWLGVISDGVSWPTTVTAASAKGSDLAKKTAKTPGSVGYANPADAKANGGFTNAVQESEFEGSKKHQIVYALVQNNESVVTRAEVENEEAKKEVPPKEVEVPAKTYADPVVEGTKIANCATDKALGNSKKTPYSYTDSWLGVTTTDPNAGTDDTSGSYYPICGLTYDLVWKHYNVPNLFKDPEAAQIAATVKDLMTYITKAGQTDVKTNYYTGFPEVSGWTSHIEPAIAAITG